MPIAFRQAGTIYLGEDGINALKNPTSLQFGPDGRLYVAEQNGTINAFTITYDAAAGTYGIANQATDQEILRDSANREIVKHLQNHNDDGSDFTTGTVNRQVTGLVVTGTAEEPVLYISSSDPRISTGVDINLDTNSGVVTRATYNSATNAWDVVDLVRGLPRSEENHSVNGMLLSEDGTKLLLQVGSFTNHGGASDYFAYTNEYALSGAVLELDLSALDALPDQVDPTGGRNGTPRTFKYDLPTLDDPNVANVTDGVGEDANGMDEDGPWGGNDGLNMAILPADAPLRIYADGVRNPYDLARRADGSIYTLENGGNFELGDAPNRENGDDDGDGIFNEAIGTPTAPNSGYAESEPLFKVEEGGFYFFANPVRSNQNMAWTVYDDTGNPDQSLAVNFVNDISSRVPAGLQIPEGYLIDPSKFAAGPGVTLADLSPQEAQDRLFQSGDGLDRDDPAVGAITRVGSSTNGIIVYDSKGAAFDGVLDGKIFVAQFNGSVTLLNLDPAGEEVVPVPTEGPDGIFGTADDGVQAGGQDGIFEVANTAAGIGLTVPLDLTNGPNGTIWIAEIGANRITIIEPTDVILPGDTDGDDDGILNVDDPFLRDALNGRGTLVAAGDNLLWDFDANQDENRPGPAGFGGGLTGVMIDKTTDFEQYLQSQSDRDGQIIQLDNVKFTTAAGGGTTVIEEVEQGTAAGNANDGKFLFHTGLTLEPGVTSAMFRWAMINPAASGAISGPSQEIGGYLGTGDQSNYLKIAAKQTTAGTSGIEIVLENNDQIAQTVLLTSGSTDVFNSAGIPSSGKITLEFDVDLVAGTATPTARYGTNAGEVLLTGAAIDLSGTNVLDAIRGTYQVQGQDTGLALGLWSSNFGQNPADTFQAIFDEVSVQASGAAASPPAIDPIPDLVVNELSTVDVNISATDADGNNTVTLSASVADANGVLVDPALYSVTPTGPGTAQFAWTTPDVLADTTYTVTVIADDGTTTPDTETFLVTVEDVPSTGGGAVLYRVNAGGTLVAATDGGPDWSADTATANSPFLTEAGNNAVVNVTFGAGTLLPPEAPSAVFESQRASASWAPNMAWAFDVAAPGTYGVRLFVREWWGVAADAGGRVFDLALEGSVPASFDNIDPAGDFGFENGGLVTATVQVTDGTLNLEFLSEVRNPILNAIEIVSLDGAPPSGSSPVLAPIADVGVNELSTVTVNLAATDADGNNTVTLSASVVDSNGVAVDPALYSVTPTGPGTAQFAWTTPDVLADTTYTVTVTADDGTTTPDTETFVVTVEDVPSTGGGAVLYRVNAGGTLVAATDGGPDWSADTATANSPFLTEAGNNAVVNVTFGAGTLLPPEAPSAVFESQRASASWAPNMAWAFDVATPGLYEVRLFVREWWGVAADAGGRVFDLALEGSVPASFDNIDPAGDFGFENGGLVTATVQVTDGTLNLEFLSEVRNPILNAIEIVSLDGAPPSGSSPVLAPIADVGVNELSTVTVNLAATDADGNNTVTLSASVVNSNGVAVDPALYSVTPTGPGTAQFAWTTPDVLADTTYTVTVTADDGTTTPDTETFVVTVDDVQSAPPVVVSITSATARTVGEAEGTVQVSVTADAVVPVGSVVDVTFEIVGGTADAGSDFSYGPGGTLSGNVYTATLPIAGGSVDLQIPVSILPDPDPEGDETFAVRLLSTSANATLGAVTETQFTIIDDDSSSGGGAVLYRVNAGGTLVAATDGGPDWSADTATANSPFLTEAGNNAVVNVTFGAGTLLPPEAPSAVFESQRASASWAPNMAWAFDVATPGLYEVRLFVREWWGVAADAGGRVFDLALEGSVPASFDNIDPAGDFGFENGGLVTATVQVTDGTLNLEFLSEVRNPILNAIEIVSLDGAPPSGSSPVLAPIADVGVNELSTVTVNLAATDADGNNTVTLSASVVDSNGVAVDPALYSVTPTGPGTAQFAWTTPDVLADTTYTVTVTADDGTTTPDTETFVVTVDDVPSTGGGAVLYRVNAGGTLVAATDGGPDWSADTATANSPFLTEAGNNAVVNVTFGAGTLLPPEAPSAVFESQRASASWAPNMAWAFDVATPGLYEVRLFVREWWGVAADAGGRVFDLALEGSVPASFDNIDPAGDFGFENGGLVTATVQVTDGTLNLEFLSEVRNPILNAIEIVSLDGTDVQPATQGEAVLSVNRGFNNIETSNFTSGSFEIINTGEKSITSIEIDVTDALLRDAVFDPFGVAGDTVSKVLTIDSDGGTGVVVPTGGFGQSTIGTTYFGAGGEFGFERIRLEFTDFDPGETLTFSVDMDPNSVRGATKGPLDAGAVITDKPGNPNDDTWDVGGVGGAELINSLFSVTYDDASSASGRLMGQGTGQQIGARAIATQAPNADAVTLSVNGLGAGDTGSYETGGPSVTVQGEAGQTARVVLAKGFIVPFENTFPDTAASDDFHDLLDTQLADLAAAAFPANNVAEFQYVDIALDGTVQDITSLFDFTQVSAFTIPSQYYAESELPLAFAASVIDTATDLPQGPVTAPIYLEFDNGTGVSSSPPPAQPMTGSFAPNAQGNFVIDVNEMDGGNLSGWTLRTDIAGATGGDALSWDGNQFFANPSNGQLSYSFTPTLSGTYYMGLASQRLSNPGGEHNDAFTRILGPDSTPLVARDGVKFSEGVKTVYSPNFVGGVNGPPPEMGWHKTFQTGSAKDEWDFSNLNMDGISLPLAYELQGGATYTAQIAARSNMYLIDQIQLIYVENPPNVDPSNGTIEVTQPFSVARSAELSDRDAIGNVAPMIDPIADLGVNETDTVDLDIVATDADAGDTVALSILVEAPNGAVVTPSEYSFTDNGNGTADFIWTTPDVATQTDYTVTVTAADGVASPVEEVFVITVEDGSGTPPNQITVTESITADAEQNATGGLDVLQSGVDNDLEAGGAVLAGFFFDDVSIDAGVTVTSATLTAYSQRSQSVDGETLTIGLESVSEGVTLSGNGLLTDAFDFVSTAGLTGSLAENEAVILDVTQIVTQFLAAASAGNSDGTYDLLFALDTDPGVVRFQPEEFGQDFAAELSIDYDI